MLLKQDPLVFTQDASSLAQANNARCSPLLLQRMYALVNLKTHLTGAFFISLKSKCSVFETKLKNHERTHHKIHEKIHIAQPYF